RDLQSVLAEQRTLEEDSDQDVEERDLSLLQALSEERTAILRQYQKRLDELTDERDRLADRLAEIDLLADDPDSHGLLKSTHSDSRPELNSLEELMAETVVMTDEESEGVDFDLDDTAIQKQSARELVDMVAPEAMVPAEERAEPANDGRHGTLIVTFQGGYVLRFPVFDRDITIGRSAKSDIQINSEFVSRHHARIAVGKAGPVIEDVSSMNGIAVDAKNVKRHIFKSGDVVVLGTTRLTFMKNESTESS
ncbi:MAG: FHA domain-containing protein, partial [Gammaproteobacteria bacterium]